MGRRGPGAPPLASVFLYAVMARLRKEKSAMRELSMVLMGVVARRIASFVDTVEIQLSTMEKCAILGTY